jgi:two-component system LytT family response regulator
MTKPETLRALIVDDEALARRGLRKDLASDPTIEVVGDCADGFEAVRLAAELKPDLVFLDIQMPKLDGFEVLELLAPETAVIFVTAHDEHAVRAFEVNAVDYLLKPVDPDRLRAALERVRERRGRRASLPVAALAAASRSAGAPLARILVRDGAKVHVLPIESIDYIQARDDYIELRAAGKSHLKQQTLADVEQRVDPSRFVRIHRSYLLNVDRIARIELIAKDSRLVILKDGTQLPLSRSGHARLREML